ncbi:MAG: dihydropteroate synthase [Thermoanaerobaculia bacterium]|nr:dihydropteroate synthase [Thermoanaerobaculia bacterium]MCZ7651166.1 dihydropteroate synthase [Thermoanaerobaculia bacterium]
MADLSALPQPTRFRLSLPRGRELQLEAGRPVLLGVVNITPDSFSDGGRFLAPEAAIEHGLRLLAEGAGALDLGAESTRPGGGVYGAGARPVPAAEELARLLPVLTSLRERTAAPLAVDSRHAEVARAALAAGADLINDVSALGDPEMAGVVATAGCPLVLMHARGGLATMQSEIRFRDVVAEVREELLARVEVAVAAGIPRERLLVDPGIGFGKTAAQSALLIARLDVFRSLGLPVLLGASRKSFIGEITGAGVGERLPGSLAAALWAALRGAALLRVHDVGATRQALRLWSELAAAGEEAA